MDEWDQEQLEKVVKQKHAAEASNKTDIICKFFLEAVEKKQYGWFWQCPNGGKDCKYRHALPPGYVSTYTHEPTQHSLCAAVAYSTYVSSTYECCCLPVDVLIMTHVCLGCRYVLKSQMKELLELEAKNAISIEEEIEMERKKVDAKTPITEEVCNLCACYRAAVVFCIAC